MRSHAQLRLRARPFLGFALSLTALLAPPARSAPQSACGWTPVADSPQGRYEPITAVVDGKLFLIGGFKENIKSLARIDSFDPVSATWTQHADMPSAFNHTIGAVDGTDVWTAGGFEGDHPGVGMTAVWKYDTAADTWIAGPDLPEARAAGTLVRHGRNLHFYGGVKADRRTVTSDHWVLDIDTPIAWTTAAPLPVPRCHHSGIELDGLLYAIGGADDHDQSPRDLKAVHAYDPTTDTWTARKKLPYDRSHFEPGTFLLDGRIFVAGGRSHFLPANQLQDLTAYDPLANTWTVMPPLPRSLIAPAVREIDGTVYAGVGAIEFVPQVSMYSMPAGLLTGELVRANAGGGAYASASGQSWCADHGALSGQSYTNPQVTSISGTADDELYTSERLAAAATPNTLGYGFALPNGPYRVRLRFAEIFWGAPGGASGGAGSRVFDVLLEGQVVLDDYDIAASVGVAAADVHTFDLLVLDGMLDIDFLSSVDSPKVSAIEVTALPAGTIASYCPAMPNTVGPGATMEFAGTLDIAEDSFQLRASGLPSKVPGLFLHGGIQGSLPFGEGTLCLTPPFKRITPPVLSSTGGVSTLPFDFAKPYAAALAPGVTTNFQLWYRDKFGGPAGFNLSSGLQVRFD